MFQKLTENANSFILVVCPLNSLINNQLKEIAHLPCCTLTDINRIVEKEVAPLKLNLKGKKGKGAEKEEHKLRCEKIRQILAEGKFRFIYATPESFAEHEEWQDTFQGPYFMSNCVGFIIDEAHCVKNYDSFRPLYAELHLTAALFRSKFMAVTATSTQDIRKIFEKDFFSGNPFKLVIDDARPPD